jgi:hypothetical protein
MNECNLNCIDSVRANLESNAWPASWGREKRHRDGYLATIKSREQRLTDRLEYLKVSS